MPLFNFRLAPVLRVREIFQEEKELELATLLDRRRCDEEEIAEIDRQRYRIEALADTDAGTILSASELHRRSEYVESLIRQVRKKNEQLRILDQAIIIKRAEVVEALRQVRTLERLRDRWERRFYSAQAQQEQKSLDEISARNFPQRRGGQRLP